MSVCARPESGPDGMATVHGFFTPPPGTLLPFPPSFSSFNRFLPLFTILLHPPPALLATIFSNGLGSGNWFELDILIRGYLLHQAFNSNKLGLISSVINMGASFLMPCFGSNRGACFGKGTLKLFGT